MALSNEHKVVATDSWGLLVSLVRAKPIAAVLFDPMIDGLESVSTSENVIKKYPSVPFIAYVCVDAPSMRAVARLAKAGLQDVVLFGVDDSPQELREKVDSVGFSTLTHLFARHLRPFLTALPPSLARTVEHLFHAPHEYAHTEDLASAASVTVSCLYRSFKTANLASPRKFLTGARILRGYKYLLESSFSVAQVAEKTGYSSSKPFVRHIREIFGVLPSELRASVIHDKAMSTLCQWLTGPDHARRCERKILNLSRAIDSEPKTRRPRVRRRRANKGNATSAA